MCCATPALLAADWLHAWISPHQTKWKQTHKGRLAAFLQARSSGQPLVRVLQVWPVSMQNPGRGEAVSDPSGDEALAASAELASSSQTAAVFQTQTDHSVFINFKLGSLYHAADVL